MIYYNPSPDDSPSGSVIKVCYGVYYYPWIETLVISESMALRDYEGGRQGNPSFRWNMLGGIIDGVLERGVPGPINQVQFKE